MMLTLSAFFLIPTLNAQCNVIIQQIHLFSSDNLSEIKHTNQFPWGRESIALWDIQVGLGQPHNSESDKTCKGSQITGGLNCLQFNEKGLRACKDRDQLHNQCYLKLYLRVVNRKPTRIAIISHFIHKIWILSKRLFEMLFANQIQAPIIKMKA